MWAPRRRRPIYWILFILLAGCGDSSDRSFEITVKDHDGHPIPRVEIKTGGGRPVTTDERGVALVAIPPGRDPEVELARADFDDACYHFGNPYAIGAADVEAGYTTIDVRRIPCAGDSVVTPSRPVVAAAADPSTASTDPPPKTPAPTTGRKQGYKRYRIATSPPRLAVSVNGDSDNKNTTFGRFDHCLPIGEITVFKVGNPNAPSSTFEYRASAYDLHDQIILDTLTGEILKQNRALALSPCP